jgi:hypothetical protein
MTLPWRIPIIKKESVNQWDTMHKIMRAVGRKLVKVRNTYTKNLKNIHIICISSIHVMGCKRFGWSVLMKGSYILHSSLSNQHVNLISYEHSSLKINKHKCSIIRLTCKFVKWFSCIRDRIPQ